MIPELGKYAVEVLMAYAVTIGGLAALIGESVLHATRIKAQLQNAEQTAKARHKHD